MEVKNYFATDTQGNVLGSAQVYLYLAGTTTLATGLQNISGAALGNPFTSEANGLVQFKAPDNNYDLRVVKPGREFTIRIQCFDGIAFLGQVSEVASPGKIPMALPSGILDASWMPPPNDSVYDYDELRSYSGKSSVVFVSKPGIWGPFKYLGVVPGAVDNDSMVIVGADGGVWSRVFSGPVSLHWFNCPLDGTTDATAAFARWSAQLKIGQGLIPPGKYVCTTIAFNTVGHSPTIGGLSIEATGATILGACDILVNSCKRLSIKGLEGFETNLHLNGAWFFQANDLKLRLLICGSSPGTVFSDNYWNTFIGGQFQSVLTHKNSGGPSNKFVFLNVALRGNATQGYTSTQDYAFKFEANQNVQDWTWIGGDISYHNIDILYADPLNVSDIEILFNDPYLDTKYIKMKTRPKTRIRVDSHAANDLPASGLLSEVARGGSHGYRSDRAAGWHSDTLVNLVPNGDFYDVLPSYVGANLPIGSSNGAVVSSRSGSGFSGGAKGSYINVSQPATSSNSIRIRPKAAPFSARYSCVVVMRNANPGAKTIRMSFGGLFFNAYITDSEWCVATHTTGLDIPAGTVSDIQVYTEDGTPFNIDICYAGVFYGEVPRLFSPSDRHQNIFGSTSWNPPNILPGAQSPAQTVSVPGASIGDFADASFTVPLSGMSLKASVSATDTVEVFLRNDTASAIDLGAGTLRVRVHKASY